MQLRIEQPGGKAHRIALNRNRSLRIGCDPLLEIVLKGPGIAPLHCGVVYQQGQFQLLPSKDVGQIELNGSPVSAAALKVGDRFHVGRFAFQVVADAPAGGAKGAAPAGGAVKPAKPSIAAGGRKQPSQPTGASSPPSSAAASEAELTPLDGLQPLDELTPLEEASPGDLAPLEEPSLEDLAPLQQASADELAPLDEASWDELAPLDDAGLDELAPLEDAGLEELTPLGQAAPDQLAPLEDAPLDELMPFDAPGGKVAPAGEAVSLFDLDEQSPSATAADVIPLDESGIPREAGAAPESAAKATSKASVATPAGVIPGAALPARKRSVAKLAIAVAGCGVLLIGAVVAVWLLVFRGPSADESYLAADTQYKARTYAVARTGFDEFVTRFPNDPRAGEARVRRDLANLHLAVDQAGDWPTVLKTAKRTTDDWGSLAWSATAQAGLAELVPSIVEALVDRAQTADRQNNDEAARESAAQAREALTLLRNFAPPQLRVGHGTNEAELSLVLLERKLNRRASLDAAITALNEAAASESTDEAYRRRTLLLREHPELSTDSRLAAAMREVAAVEARRVQYVAGPLPERGAAIDTGATTEEPLQWKATPVVRSAAAGQADGGSVFGVLDRVTGVAYGLDSQSGRMLWQRSVGVGADMVPAALATSPPSMLLADSRRNELVRVESASGKTVWQCSIGPFAGEPVVLADRALVVGRSGSLVEVDLASGSVTGRYEFPLPLAAPPCVDQALGRYYQLADHSLLFVIDSQSKQCRSAFYLGHEPGSVNQPPLLAGNLLLIAEEMGLRQSRLRVLSRDGALREVASLPFTGRVAEPLVATESYVFAALDDGSVASFQLRPGDQRPLAAGPRVVGPRGDGLPASLSVADGRLWVAGEELVAYSLDAGQTQFTPLVRALAGQSLTQPAAMVDGQMLAVRRAPDHLGLRVSPVQFDRSPPRWETRLSTPLAALPRIELDGSVTMLTRSGDLIRLSREQLEEPDPIILESLVAGSTESSPLPFPMTVVSVGNDGSFLFAPPRGFDSLWLSRPAASATASTSGHATESTAPPGLLETPAPLAAFTLPGNLADPPVVLAGQVLAAIEGGPLFVLDATTLAPSGEPFWPPQSDTNAKVGIRGPVAVDGKSVVIAIDNGAVYRLGVAGSPQPSLTVDAETTLASPLVRQLAVVGERVWGVNGAGRLVALALPDLEEAAVSLDSPVIWGPEAVGQFALVATADGRLHCLADAGAPVWSIPLPGPPLVGALAVGDRFVLASADGMLELVDTESGEHIGKPIALARALSLPPIALGNRLLIATTDGSLHFLKKTLDEWASNGADADLAAGSDTPTEAGGNGR